jgi:spermidine/putrescine ABC transporter ATP-binding subunit
MASLELKNVTKKFNKLVAVNNFSLTVNDGEIVALLGESGCGKTTTLRMVAGFTPLDEGEIIVDGKIINNIPPYKRNIGIFFQNYALFPHMTVFENVAFGLKVKKLTKSEIKEEVTKIIGLVGLDGMDDRYPRQLSGGQQQRVALARSLVVRPSVLLLDEPLSNLDAKLRTSMQTEIKRIQKALGITTIIVTHDQQEAISLADRVIVMKNGQIIQQSSPESVYEKPENPFVADFMGFKNFIPGKILSIEKDGYAQLSMSGLPKSFQVDSKNCMDIEKEEDVIIAIRPEKIKLVSLEKENALKGTVGNIIYKGDYYHVEINGIFEKELILHANSFNGKSGDEVGIWLSPEDLRIYKKVEYII